MFSFDLEFMIIKDRSNKTTLYKGPHFSFTSVSFSSDSAFFLTRNGRYYLESSNLYLNCDWNATGMYLQESTKQCVNCAVGCFECSSETECAKCD